MCVMVAIEEGCLMVMINEFSDGFDRRWASVVLIDEHSRMVLIDEVCLMI